jgi:pimeloyl-ACP methyl ester carboxylesterase
MEWTDRETLFRAYRAAPVFARWKEEFLRDYVSAVTEDTEGGRVRLRYPREWEARIFETVPPDTWLAMPRLRHVPVLILRGEHSTTFRRDALQTVRWFMPHAEFVEVAGADHFVPMSRPERTAAVVREFLEGV